MPVAPSTAEVQAIEGERVTAPSYQPRKNALDKERFIARIRHIAWVGYQLGADLPFNRRPTDDQLDSLLDGVKFALEHPDMTPEENHENWLRKKREQGWTYGSVKDPVNKTHPDMVPYAELPTVEKRKDVLDRMGHELALELWDELFEERNARAAARGAVDMLNRVPAGRKGDG